MFQMSQQLIKITKSKRIDESNYSMKFFIIFFLFIVFFWLVSLTKSVYKIGAGSGTACYFSLEVFLLIIDRKCLFIYLNIFNQKHMAVIFALCTVAALATMIMCTYFSSFYPDPTDFLLWFTMGNIVKSRWEESQNFTLMKFVFHSVDSLDNNIFYYLNILFIFSSYSPPFSFLFSFHLSRFLLIPEIIYCFIFVIGMKIARRNMKAVAEEADDQFLSSGDYGLMVSGIPKEEKDAGKVAEHFKNLGMDVHSVLLCYDIRDYGPIQEKLDNAVVGVCY